MAEEQKPQGHYPNASDHEKNWYLARIEPETSRLLQDASSWLQKIATILYSANAGGAVAILAYIEA